VLLQFVHIEHPKQKHAAGLLQCRMSVLGILRGTRREAPCVPKREAYLDAYIAAAGIADDRNGPLFCTTGRFTRRPHRMRQQDGYRMIQRRPRQAGIKTRIGNHSMRATGIADYLKSDGTLEQGQTMAATPPVTPPSSTTGARTRRRSTSMRK